MFLKNECAACILEDIMAAAKMYDMDNEMFTKKILDVISNDFSEDKIPSALITKVHQILKNELKEEILFYDRRKKANKYAQNAIEYLFRKNDIEYLVEMVARANGMDFRTAGIGYKEDLTKGIAEGNIIGNISNIVDTIKNANNILYVLDNVGEIAFDKLLIEHLISCGKTLTCMAKKGAITSDAIKEDLEFAGYYDLDISIKYTQSDTLGLQYEDIELIKSIEADIIISKGQANFYFFNAYGKSFGLPIIFMFSVKCDIVSKLFNAQKGDIIIRELS